MQLQDGAEWANPEDVLVLETAGRIDDFYKAVEQVEGLEWMLEQDKNGVPDEYFYFPDDEGNPSAKELPSRVYLVSANNEALREMVSLFKQYAENSRTKLPRGYAKFKTYWTNCATFVSGTLRTVWMELMWKNGFATMREKNACVCR